jgi:hypothetical protein
MRISLLCMAICLCICAARAQPRYSRSINEIFQEPKVDQDHFIFDPHVLPDDQLLFTFSKNVSSADTSLRGYTMGWLRVNADWTERDTFWYPRWWLSGHFDKSVILGDTIIHSMVNDDAIQKKEFHILGHRWTTKDSLFHWKYSMNHLSGIYNHKLMLLQWAPEGHLVGLGQYMRPGPGFSYYNHYYLFEIGNDGRVLRKVDELYVQQGFESFGNDLQKLLIDEDHYYFVMMGEIPHPQWISKFTCTLIAVDRSDLSISWRRDMPAFIPSNERLSGLSFSRDSQALYFAYERAIYPDEFDQDTIPFEEWPEDSVAEVLTIDCATGNIIRTVFQYHLRRDSIILDVSTSLTSRQNGDVYCAGTVFNRKKANDSNGWFGGLIIRADPDEGIRWRLQVVEHFHDNYRIKGYKFNHMVEAENGDIILTGSGLNEGIPPYGWFGWVMRIGPDGCASGEYCHGDTLSMSGLISSVSPGPTPVMERTLALKLSPNPADRGSLVQVVPYNEESPDIIQEVVWYDMSGRPVHRQVADSPYGALEANQLRVPDTLPPGIYQLELLAGRYQRYHGRLVVR